LYNILSDKLTLQTGSYNQWCYKGISCGGQYGRHFSDRLLLRLAAHEVIEPHKVAGFGGLASLQPSLQGGRTILHAPATALRPLQVVQVALIEGILGEDDAPLRLRTYSRCCPDWELKTTIMWIIRYSLWSIKMYKKQLQRSWKYFTSKSCRKYIH